jgi:hypothetical protein
MASPLPAVAPVRHAGIEPVNGQRLFAAVKRDAPNIGRNCYCAAHPGIPQQYFCSRCGIYTHHRRRSNPNQYGVNVACLKGVSPFDFSDVPVIDGANHPADQGRGYEIVGHLRFIRTEDRSAAGGD